MFFRPPFRDAIQLVILASQSHVNHVVGFISVRSGGLSVPSNLHGGSDPRMAVLEDGSSKSHTHCILSNGNHAYYQLIIFFDPRCPLLLRLPYSAAALMSKV